MWCISDASIQLHKYQLYITKQRVDESRNTVWSACGYWVVVLLFILLCLSQTVRAEEFAYTIRVNFTTAQLSLMAQNKTMHEFSVALPKHAPTLPVESVVKKVILGAWWHPTTNTRRAYKQKKGIVLPEHIAPGDSRNAMGVGKIVIVFTTPGANQTVRIHGTNDPKSIGKRISRGCIRMFNNDFLELAGAVNNTKTKIIFEK